MPTEQFGGMRSGNAELQLHAKLAEVPPKPSILGINKMKNTLDPPIGRSFGSGRFVQISIEAGTEVCCAAHMRCFVTHVSSLLINIEQTRTYESTVLFILHIS